MRIGNDRKIPRLAIRISAMSLLALFVFSFASPVVAQMPAMLPLKDTVPETETLPIDGVWTISTIGKKIRIERGRSFAIDSWLHLFVLQVQPDMVVSTNYERMGPGQYTAQDLPLAGPASLELKPDGNLSVSVRSAFGPVAFDLIQEEVDDPAALDAEIALMRGEDVPSTPSEPPAAENPGSLANCKKLGVDPATGDIVCKD